MKADPGLTGHLVLWHQLHRASGISPITHPGGKPSCLVGHPRGAPPSGCFRWDALCGGGVLQRPALPRETPRGPF